jgi:hypothetical protein
MTIRRASDLYVGVLAAALLGVFSLIWVYTYTKRVNFLPKEAGGWMAHMQMIKSCKVGDVAVLGSSRANAAFLPRLMNMHVANLAMTGGTPIEAYYEARDIYRCPHPPKVVILSFSGYDLVNSNWFWDRSARFGLLDYNDLQDIAYNSARNGDKVLYKGAFGSEPPPAMKNWLYSNHFPPYDFASLLAARGGLRRRENSRSAAQALASDGQQLVTDGKCAAAASWDAKQTTFHPRPILVFYLERLIDYLEARGVKVLYVDTPLSAANYEQLHDAYKQGYVDLLNTLQRHDPNLRIVGPIFSSLDMCSFSDIDHVNAKGAETFTRAITPLISTTLDHWGEPVSTPASTQASAAPTDRSSPSG